MSRSIKALIAGLAIATTAQTVSAATVQNPSNLNTVVVRYDDLDLEKESGATTLLTRLSRAARKVCELPTPSSASPHHQDKRPACREGALQNAVATVNHPVLTELYQSTRSNSTAKVASL